MGRFKDYLRNTRQALLAVVIIALVPAAVEASGIGFRNDTQQPIYVQGSTLVNGQIKRGPLLYIKPGQTAWDVNLANGTRTITVYNTANQLLIQGTQAFQGADLFFAIELVPRSQPPQFQLRKQPVPIGK